MLDIPADYEVQPISPDHPNAATCGTCGLSWDDVTSTSMTPTPSGRCPFEYFHPEPDHFMVTLRCSFEAENEADAIQQMREWIVDYGGQVDDSGFQVEPL